MVSTFFMNKKVKSYNLYHQYLATNYKEHLSRQNE